ncbi:MAG: xanthine dehydrogenase family protein molybdopterin-binding subunit [Mesorhizobium sp.]|uniref:xanthine dehydrogenase family protein molybdopterin-binding subunit n=1 Tax=unclassified Mesorhizobium TaxID=325217 RepID=UPI000FE5D800|nr:MULTISPECIES: xanthine dehydrogenase family protein molybdopterin-binding subunit [unclassified Mesorhizobium]RWC08021.1 MAG: xanthine dehydrogenase family protein molybdopterin-binding subunit [Mesorhizobium sp.]RWC37047.1 MAG: xanthine dehydrogenase family protein molybdopterin-binding subunit [Mesorhizobium sp.]RWD45781.1 MAG: xanthine dehydrogenase family protein molybdopterin-binding subunit [Mesorhizobium sp.]TGT94120.1 xanthine dehydrogenase family protein molybdopterin-binding subuni
MTKTKASENRPSETRDGIIGRPIDRVDGPLKVTGGAIYAYENALEGTAYGYILGAAVAKGRIAEIDTAEAERAPAVLLVMTHRNAPAQPDFGPAVTPTVPEVFTRARPALNSERVRYYDEPVALVVAETFEAARAAAGLIKVRYDEEPGLYDLPGRVADAYAPKRTNAGFETDSVVGDFESAFAAAPVKIDATYRTPFEHHNPMEPHATLAAWSGNELTIHTSAQTLANFRAGIASTLRIPPERVRIVSPFIGGGFGSKLIAHSDTILAALAAQVLQRPVKIALTRQQMFANAGHRAEMIQQVRLGADADGRLTGIAHDVWSATSSFEEYCEQTAVFARSLYAAPNRLTRHRLVPLDINRGEWMRSPGEAPGMLAFECAMDELAERLGLDPIELRVRNEPAQDPERGVPFSTRNLVDCMEEGARRFDWERRDPTPGRTREGRKLIGYGMAAAIRPNYIGAATARVAIDRDGRVTARLDMTDIGTGSYTILTQIAAESLGVPISSVKVELGDSRFPRTAGSGGSWGAASAGSALHNACNALKQRILEAAQSSEASPLRGANATEASFADSEVRVGQRSAGLADLIRRIAPDGFEAEGSVAAGATTQSYKAYSQHSYGAHFAEVAVDCDTGEIRMRRMLAVMGAGRILNAKTARSQIIGGMTWGIGAALMEQAVLDRRYGHFVNHDLAEYHVPINGDVPEMEVVFLEDHDDKANPLGAKGLGELGVCGAGAAIANAIYNATGVRVREFPITLDKLLPALPVIAL